MHGYAHKIMGLYLFIDANVWPCAGGWPKYGPSFLEKYLAREIGIEINLVVFRMSVIVVW